MKIAFVKTEPSDERFFSGAFREHEVRFLDALEEVSQETEVLSIFIDSKVDAGFLAGHPNLRFIATRSTAFDYIDLDACQQHSVTVSCIPTYGDHTVAEHTMALLLAVARRFHEVASAVRQKRFSYENIRGYELHSKTLGIVGAGRIGQRVIPLAKAFGMEVIAYDIHTDPSAAEALGFRYVSFPELLRRSDVISLHAPLNPTTYHLFNRAAFAKCKPGLLLINTARGALIDTDALIEALDKQIVCGVGLDVLEEESLLHGEALRVISNQILKRIQSASCAETAHSPNRVKELENIVHNRNLLARKEVFFTPHIAFNSKEATARINQATVENIQAFIKGKPKNVVSNHWLATRQPEPLAKPAERPKPKRPGSRSKR